jgi:hypothetical protein
VQRMGGNDRNCDRGGAMGGNGGAMGGRRACDHPRWDSDDPGGDETWSDGEGEDIEEQRFRSPISHFGSKLRTALRDAGGKFTSSDAVVTRNKIQQLRDDERQDRIWGRNPDLIANARRQERIRMLEARAETEQQMDDWVLSASRAREQQARDAAAREELLDQRARQNEQLETRVQQAMGDLGQPVMIDGEPYVTLQQLGEVLGAGKSTLKRWRQKGRMPRPDVPGKHHQPHMYRLSTAEDAIRQCLTEVPRAK